jgi:hypothetical protein
MCVLVIGDNWREQLDRYQSAEYADPLNPHHVLVDCLGEALMRYQKTTADIPFGEWVGSNYGYSVKKLDSGAEPDFQGVHRWGWMRLNEAGEVTELMERTIPDAFFMYIRGTPAEFLILKLGAIGWNIDGDEVTEVTEGYVASARLSDIDFPATWQNEEDGVLSFYDVIRYGEHLIDPNADELLAGLDDDALLTWVLVKC